MKRLLSLGMAGALALQGLNTPTAEAAPQDPCCDAMMYPSAIPGSYSGSGSGQSGSSRSSSGIGAALFSGGGNGGGGGNVGASDLLALGLSSDNFATTNISPAGSALGSAVSQNATSIVPAARPAISPGFLTSANIESPYAVDRVFMGTSFYNAFSVLNTTLIGNANLGVAPQVITRRVDGFDLHRFDVGFEKALFDGMASIYVRAPFLDTTDETVPVAVNGAGNLNIGFKVVLLADHCTGNILSGGLTVAAPTSRTTEVVLAEQGDNNNLFIPQGNFIQRVDSTYIQPWLAAQINSEFTFLQGYAGIVIPTDDRVVTAFNGGLTGGLKLYENPRGQITSITPFLSSQFLAAFDSDPTVIITDPNNAGNPLIQSLGTVIDIEDQIFLSPGLSVGFSNRTSFSAGLAVPVVGPRAFEIGTSLGLNILL